MKCEIEFFAVGENSKPGDAIIVRYGEPDAYQLMLVDGGHAETGETLVNHLRKYFGRDVSLEHVVLTHSDGDHASGLREVLRKIPVQKLWLHVPWWLAEEARHLFKDKRWTKEGLLAAIKKEYDIISEIVDLAIAAKCKIYYPFQGSFIGPFTVLSPSRQAYVHLLPQFSKTLEPDQALIESASMWIGKAAERSAAAMLLDKLVTKAQTWIDDKWGIELLKDGGVTSASNESSVVLHGDFGDNRRALLTGDAGIRGLTWAADYADICSLPLQQFSFVQVPHHGSRRNVGPTILGRLVGGIQPEGSMPQFEAFVSAPADDETHPRKIVLNAFMRRGGKVFPTQGKHVLHYGGFPKRDGYVDATPLSFFAKVEAYD